MKKPTNYDKYKAAMAELFAATPSEKARAAWDQTHYKYRLTVVAAARLGDECAHKRWGELTHDQRVKIAKAAKRGVDVAMQLADALNAPGVAA